MKRERDRVFRPFAGAVYPALLHVVEGNRTARSVFAKPQAGELADIFGPQKPAILHGTSTEIDPYCFCDGGEHFRTRHVSFQPYGSQSAVDDVTVYEDRSCWSTAPASREGCSLIDFEI